MSKPKGIIISGYFSPLHVGHLDMIDAAAAAGDKLIVVVNNNAQQMLKKGKIIIDEKDRVRVVEALAKVDDVILSIDETRDISKTIQTIADKYSDHELVFANGGDRSSGAVVPETGVCEANAIEMVFGMGGNEKADSSTRINMELGYETEASALPSENS